MKKITALLTGAALLIGVTTSAQALSLYLTDGVNNALVTDGGVGDMDGTVGAVTFMGALGDFILNVSTGISKPILGSAGNPFMDLNSVDVSSANATNSTLQIFLTDTNFTGQVPGFKADIGGITGGTVQYKTFLGAGNGEFETTTLLTDALYLTGPFSGSVTSPLLALSGPYSLTQEIDIFHPLTGNTIVTSFDANIAPVPEPGTMVLFGVGLLGLAIYGKRRMNNKES